MPAMRSPPGSTTMMCAVASGDDRAHLPGKIRPHPVAASSNSTTNLFAEARLTQTATVRAVALVDDPAATTWSLHLRTARIRCGPETIHSALLHPLLRFLLLATLSLLLELRWGRHAAPEGTKERPTQRGTRAPSHPQGAIGRLATAAPLHFPQSARWWCWWRDGVSARAAPHRQTAP